LNYGLIYGELGMPEMGLHGAGIATLIAKWYCVIAMTSGLLFSQKFKVYFHKPFQFILQKSYATEVLKIGIPSGVQYLFEVMAFAGAGIMMGWIGTKELAAHQIAIQVASFTFMFALGFSFATAVRIGHLYGQQNYKRLRLVGIGSFLFIGFFLAIMGLIILVSRNWIPTWFIQDIEDITLASQLFIVAFLWLFSVDGGALGVMD
jgi:MATE family multidrug resistance protein